MEPPGRPVAVPGRTWTSRAAMSVVAVMPIVPICAHTARPANASATPSPKTTEFTTSAQISHFGNPSGGLGRRGGPRTVGGGPHLLAAERRQQAGQEQRAADAGQPAGD